VPVAAGRTGGTMTEYDWSGVKQAGRSVDAFTRERYNYFVDRTLALGEQVDMLLETLKVAKTCILLSTPRSREASAQQHKALQAIDAALTKLEE